MPKKSLVFRNALPSSSAEWRALSQRLAHREICLDFTGIDSISDRDLDDLLSAVPREWDFSEYEGIIAIDSLSSSMDESLHQAIERRKNAVSLTPLKLGLKPAVPPPKPAPFRSPSLRPSLVGGAALGLLAVTGAFTLFKAYTFFTGYRVSQQRVVIGAVNASNSYKTLQAYLEQKLVPDDFWKHFRGEQVQVAIDAGTPERDLAYPQAISLVNEHQWDVAFAYSPIVGIAAEDAGYETIGVMFPGQGQYQASIFVSKNSSIQSLDQINEKHTVAMGDFFSASKFYMPSYEFYGRRITVLSNIPTQEIFNLVRKGKVDIGVGILTKEESDFRVLKQSRDIPSSGVYLSPKLTASDQQELKAALLNAPEEIKSRKQANYGKGEKPDFEYFRGIVRRVQEIMACSDFRKNPVDFFCGPAQTAVRIEGRINGVEQKGNDYYAVVNQFNGQICPLHITDEVLKGLSIVDSAFKLQGYYVDAIAAVPKGSQCTKQTPVEIFQPNQIELSRRLDADRGSGS
ncbi:PhnD/SsuA/transferrin family substrate-binding protein [Leptolyngbya sp. ST-U4]|uniref:phosphate/phosphite/phosphonate ABC transporter substrate-binding protein n=1 Tax=Leptolyngbya sp. ST-U4 TaxID=2933912 RepID=UPI003299963B